MTFSGDAAVHSGSHRALETSVVFIFLVSNSRFTNSCWVFRHFCFASGSESWGVGGAGSDTCFFFLDGQHCCPCCSLCKFSVFTPSSHGAPLFSLVVLHFMGTSQTFPLEPWFIVPCLLFRPSQLVIPSFICPPCLLSRTHSYLRPFCLCCFSAPSTEPGLLYWVFPLSFLFKT